MKRKLIVVDTETTGFDATKNAILSLGAVIYQDGGISSAFYTLVREPGLFIPLETIAVNAIGPNEVASGPDPWLAVQRFVSWLNRNELFDQQELVAHGAHFDIPFLKRLWRLAGQDYEVQFSHRVICTQSTARCLDYAGRINLPGNSASLDNVAAVFGLKRDGEVHNALEDARLTARVLGKLIDRIR